MVKSLKLKDIEFDADVIKKLRHLGSVLKNIHTRKVLEILSSNVRMNVTEIYVAARIEQSVTSQALAHLRNASLVIREKEGKAMYYSVHTDNAKKLCDLMQQISYIMRG